MKKTDIILKLSDEFALSKKDAKIAFEIILEELSGAIASGDGVEVRGFGAFYKKHRPAHKAVNPRTSEKIQVAEKYLPFFKPGKQLKELVNNN